MPEGGGGGGESLGGGPSGSAVVLATQCIDIIATFTNALHNIVLQEEIDKPEEFKGDESEACKFIHQCHDVLVACQQLAFGTLTCRVE